MATGSITATTGGTGFCRFPNGIQICWGHIDSVRLTNYSPRTQNGFTVYDVVMNIAFQKPFSEKPNVLINKSGGAAAFQAWASWNSSAITEVDFAVASAVSSSTSEVNCEYIAIGRWK